MYVKKSLLIVNCSKYIKKFDVTFFEQLAAFHCFKLFFVVHQKNEKLKTKLNLGNHKFVTVKKQASIWRSALVARKHWTKKTLVVDVSHRWQPYGVLSEMIDKLDDVGVCLAIHRVLNTRHWTSLNHSKKHGTYVIRLCRHKAVGYAVGPIGLSDKKIAMCMFQLLQKKRKAVNVPRLGVVYLNHYKEVSKNYEQ